MDNKDNISWSKRIGWLLLIWSASVLTLFITAGLFKLLMRSAGFHS